MAFYETNLTDIKTEVNSVKADIADMKEIMLTS